MKIWINGNDSLEITMPEDIANKNELEELIHQLTDVHTFIEIMEGKGKKTVVETEPHKKIGRPVGSKNKHPKKRAYTKRSDFWSKSSEEKVEPTKDVDKTLEKLEEHDSAETEEEGINGNTKYTREQLKEILTAHYKKDVNKRDRLMSDVGMTKSTFYVMKNYWIKKFGFNSQELGLN